MKTHHVAVLFALILSFSATLTSAVPLPAPDAEEGFPGSPQLEARRIRMFGGSRPSAPLRSNSMPARLDSPPRPTAPMRSNSLPANVGRPVPVHPDNMPAAPKKNSYLVEGLASGAFLGTLGLIAYEEDKKDKKKGD